ncbi:unnamed protein product [Caenorhabditis auriculariae]|uniref:S-protein homolog n=1 Tax=Caenorhabditis auriculariae TaxID=2777116 RepID=A0A8S1HI03_9PELO|nr:unnamed protein product [Caenorhabditis auriculariae]
MKIRLLMFLLLLWSLEVFGRRYRKKNEVSLVNLCDANLRLRCLSARTDLKDRYLGPSKSYSFRFHDIDRGDMHFWCDAYGLFGFFEIFDVFGRLAPSRRNQTWLIKNDGLYYENEANRVREWQWIYPPFDSYADDSDWPA